MDRQVHAEHFAGMRRYLPVLNIPDLIYRLLHILLIHE